MSIFITAPSSPADQPTTRVPFGALVLANIVSLTGNTLTNLAVPWFVLQTTGSAALTGVAAFANTLPLVLGSLVGGALADRVGHRRMSVLSDLLSGVTVALIPLLWAQGWLSYPLLIALLFLGAMFDTPGATARRALIPAVARHTSLSLEKINATFSTLQQASGLIGPPLAGILIAAFGASNVLLIDAATFVVSALLIRFFVPSERAAAAPPAVRDLGAGFRFIFGNPLLRTMILTATATNFLLSPVFGVIMPVYIKSAYGDATKLGVLSAAFGAGAIIGAIVYGAYGARLSQRWLFVGGFAGLCGSIGLLALLPPLPYMIVALIVGGIMSGPINPQVGTIMQRRTPPEMMARVFGVLVAGATCAMPISMLVAGWLVEWIGVQPTLAISAVGGLLLIGSLVFNPTLRELDQTAV